MKTKKLNFDELQKIEGGGAASNVVCRAITILARRAKEAGDIGAYTALREAWERDCYN